VGDDRIIKREEFLSAVSSDASCAQILESAAIDFPLVGRSLSFRQLLEWVLDDFRNEKNPKLKKAK
jgi:hypothetical protein